ncbi:MAG: TerB family tellurite resistance protein [Prevotella sp.]
MALGKWIGGFLGFVYGGPLGTLAGFALGWLFDKSVESDSSTDNYNNREYDDGYNQRSYGQNSFEAQRNSFLFSLLVLAAHIIKADGKVMHSEMEFLRRFLRQNFGEVAVKEGEEIILKLFDHQKRLGIYQWRSVIRDCCGQMARNMDYPQRLQLLNFLMLIAKADGNMPAEELEALREVATNLGIAPDDLTAMLNLQEGGNSLEAAYAVLGIVPEATDEEVKAAYRKMALKHHPDRVATLGEDIKKAAEQKFKEINDAKERIYKSRGL